jgi:hypothetical protein
LGGDVHLVAGYGHRCFMELRDPKKRAMIKELMLEREVHTYCARWFRPHVYTYEHLVNIKRKPDGSNICHHCLRRFVGRILDFNDILLYGPHETIGNVILFDLKPTDSDAVIMGLKRCIERRQI